LVLGLILFIILGQRIKILSSIFALRLLVYLITSLPSIVYIYLALIALHRKKKITRPMIDALIAPITSLRNKKKRVC